MLKQLLETIRNETVPLPGHPDPVALNDCWNEVFELLEVRPTQDAPDLLPAPACCASFVSYGVHHRDCRLTQTASG